MCTLFYCPLFLPSSHSFFSIFTYLSCHLTTFKLHSFPSLFPLFLTFQFCIMKIGMEKVLSLWMGKEDLNLEQKESRESISSLYWHQYYCYAIILLCTNTKIPGRNTPRDIRRVGAAKPRPCYHCVHVTVARV